MKKLCHSPFSEMNYLFNKTASIILGAIAMTCSVSLIEKVTSQANSIVTNDSSTVREKIERRKNGNKQSQSSNTATESSGGNLIGLKEIPSPNKEMIMDLDKLGILDLLQNSFYGMVESFYLLSSLSDELRNCSISQCQKI